MYVPCKRTAIATTLGVYNEKELDNAEGQSIAHVSDLGNYSSRAVPKKRTGDVSTKEQKPSSSIKKENRYKTAKTQMSASKDADFALRSTWNMVTGKCRGSVERTDTVEHVILCALALFEKMKF